MLNSAYSIILHGNELIPYIIANIETHSNKCIFERMILDVVETNCTWLTLALCNSFAVSICDKCIDVYVKSTAADLYLQNITKFYTQNKDHKGISFKRQQQVVAVNKKSNNNSSEKK